jgi:hypothetical protein
MKFERYLDFEVVDIPLLSTDYGKLAALLDNGTVAFHAHCGKPPKAARIPKFGWANSYEATSVNCWWRRVALNCTDSIWMRDFFPQPWAMEKVGISEKKANGAL